MNRPPFEIRTADHWLRELALVLERINCGLVGRDAESRILFCNERLLAWTGYEQGELLGHDVSDLFPPELRDATQREVRAALEQGDLRARLSILQRKDRSTFPVLIIPQTFEDRDGKPGGIVSVLVDLGTIQTAKPVATFGGPDLGAELDRIAGEIQMLALAASFAPPAARSMAHAELGSLSAREREVLIHLVAGERVSAIAAKLHISPHTVRNHLKALYRKLEVHSQAQLIERVRKLGAGS